MKSLSQLSMAPRVKPKLQQKRSQTRRRTHRTHQAHHEKEWHPTSFEESHQIYQELFSEASKQQNLSRSKLNEIVSQLEARAKKKSLSQEQIDETHNILRAKTVLFNREQRKSKEQRNLDLEALNKKETVEEPHISIVPPEVNEQSDFSIPLFNSSAILPSRGSPYKQLDQSLEISQAQQKGQSRIQIGGGFISLTNKQPTAAPSDYGTAMPRNQSRLSRAPTTHLSQATLFDKIIAPSQIPSMKRHSLIQNLRRKPPTRKGGGHTMAPQTPAKLDGRSGANSDMNSIEMMKTERNSQMSQLMVPHQQQSEALSRGSRNNMARSSFSRASQKEMMEKKSKMASKNEKFFNNFTSQFQLVEHWGITPETIKMKTAPGQQAYQKVYKPLKQIQKEPPEKKVEIRSTSPLYKPIPIPSTPSDDNSNQLKILDKIKEAKHLEAEQKVQREKNKRMMNDFVFEKVDPNTFDSRGKFVGSVRSHVYVNQFFQRFPSQLRQALDAHGGIRSVYDSGSKKRSRDDESAHPSFYARSLQKLAGSPRKAHDSKKLRYLQPQQPSKYVDLKESLLNSRQVRPATILRNRPLKQKTNLLSCMSTDNDETYVTHHSEEEGGLDLPYRSVVQSQIKKVVQVGVDHYHDQECAHPSYKRGYQPRYISYLKGSQRKLVHKTNPKEQLACIAAHQLGKQPTTRLQQSNTFKDFKKSIIHAPESQMGISAAALQKGTDGNHLLKVEKQKPAKKKSSNLKFNIDFDDMKARRSKIMRGLTVKAKLGSMVKRVPIQRASAKNPGHNLIEELSSSQTSVSYR